MHSDKPLKVFITGAGGFIASRLIARFQQSGAQVCGVDLNANERLEIIAGDITQPGEWQDALADADVVLHTAAKVGMSGRFEDFWRVNCLGTQHVLAAAAKHPVKRFVHLSSIVAFGFDYPDNVEENYPPRPNGVPYVDTKIASEQSVLRAHAAGEVPCTIVRPGDVYGPHSHFWTVTPFQEIRARRLMLPAMGRGHVSPVYVEDLVNGIYLAATRPEAAGQVITVTGGETVEVREFFGYYASMLNRKFIPVAPTALVTAIASILGPFLAGGDISPAAVRYIARRGGYSINKARTILGYAPAYSLEKGMAATEQWLRETGQLG